MKDDHVPLSTIISEPLLLISNSKLAQIFGVTNPTMKNWRESGVPAFHLKRIRTQTFSIPVNFIDAQKGSNKRDEQIRYDFTHGKTTVEIGREHGISSERVRQILALFGLSRNDGGKSVMILIEKSHTPKKSEKYLPNYGCLRKEVLEINNGIPLRSRMAPSQWFLQQKKNAKVRGIEWCLTFPEWMKIWDESGHFKQRGRGYGYVMARVGDTGPYAIDNVEIKTQAQNASESFYKHPASERAEKRRVTRNRKLTEKSCIAQA